MKTYTPEELKGILQLHGQWQRGLKTGVCADFSGANLRGADLSGANLRGADFSRANLRGANLSGADLSGANLSGADFSRANLRGANLSGADLSGANLRGAKGIHSARVQPLYFLNEQTLARAYKLTKSDGSGPYAASNGYEPITYGVGKEYEVKEANEDINMECAEGINLCTLDWALKNWQEGYRIFVAEFEGKDIACIPIASDGKFRVRKCKIIAEKTQDEIKEWLS